MKHCPIFIAVVLLVFFWGCKKNTNQQTPLITTTELTAPGDLSILAGGRIYEEGSDTIVEVGVCWSKIENAPTTAGDHKKGISFDNVFECSIEQLDPLTNYFVRAYASNRFGTSYGKTETINSGAIPVPPTVQTIGLQKIDITSISLVGKILSNTKLLKETGFCWNTTGNPGLNDNRVTTGSLTNGSFTCTIAGLGPNSIVYAKAYAITAGGVSFGGQMVVRSYYRTFTDHEGNTYFTTLIDGKEWMAENLRCTSFTDGSEIWKVTDNASWSSTNFSPAYCTLSSSVSLSVSEGLLYNSAVVTDARSIAPVGWHVPSRAEFESLLNYFGNSTNAGKYLMRPESAFGPEFPQLQTAFDAKLQGFRTYSGIYSSFNFYSYFHASDAFGLVIYGGGSTFMVNRAQGDGYCIRLVRD